MGKKKHQQRSGGGTAHPSVPPGAKGGLDKKKSAKKNKNKKNATAAAAAAADDAVVMPTRVAPPPPAYRLRGGDTSTAAAAATSDDSDADADDDHHRVGYLTPSSSEYDACVTTSYKGFHVDQPTIMKPSFHDDVTNALDAMVEAGYFHYDVLAAGKTVSPTFVQRTLVGERGMTYHYQKLRIFAHPWEEDETSEGSPLRAVRELNQSLRARARQLLRESPDPRVGAKVTGSCDFNVTLINLMQPAHECVDVPLKEAGGVYSHHHNYAKPQLVCFIVRNQ